MSLPLIRRPDPSQHNVLLESRARVECCASKHRGHVHCKVRAGMHKWHNLVNEPVGLTGAVCHDLAFATEAVAPDFAALSRSPFSHASRPGLGLRA